MRAWLCRVGRALQCFVTVPVSWVLAFGALVWCTAAVSVFFVGLLVQDSWPGYLLWYFPLAFFLIVLLALGRSWAASRLRHSARMLGREMPVLGPSGGSGRRSWLARLFLDGFSWRAQLWILAQLSTVVVALPFILVVDLVATTFVHVGFAATYHGTLVLALLDRWFGTGLTTVFDVSPGWLNVFMMAEVVAVPLLLYAMPWLARVHAVTSVRILGGSKVAELERRVGELAETRAGAVDAHTAELRRIERDLHDGTQAHLVNLAMRLGMAERRLADDPAAVQTLIQEARTGAEDAMTELRGVLRTMYPPVLADRGLRGALHGLAGRSTVATTVDMPDLDDVPDPVEAAAYFVVAEALTNVTKHSAASHADVTVRREPESLLVEIVDNGLGGADETHGTGIVGMRRRVEALDGWLEVTSPQGGPTAVLAEMPCGS